MEALPPELRLKILRFVGVKRLRNTLSVCQWWHDMAETLLLERLNLSAFGLIHISRHSMEAAKSLTFRLAIDVSINKGPKPYLDHAADDDYVEQWDADEPWITPYGVDEPWGTVLAHRLNEVGDWVQRCKKLTSLSLRVEHDMSPEEVTVDESLSEWKLVDLGAALWASNLAQLKINTLGAWVKADPDDHLCDLISERLPALRSVWLQLHAVCPSILRIRSYWYRHASDARIEKIVISLSMVRRDSDIAIPSKHCGRSEFGEEDDASALWREQAKEAAETFPRLKELWLLQHEEDVGNDPNLIAREFVSKVSREFEKDQYDKRNFDPTDISWSSLDTELSDEDTDDNTDDDQS